MSGGEMAGRWACAAMLAAAGAASFLRPTQGTEHRFATLAAVLPESVGAWRSVTQPGRQVEPMILRAGAGEPDPLNPYDEVATRAYSNPDGTLLLLTVAYGSAQSQERKIHRPEVCYSAQGFELLDVERGAFRPPGESPRASASGVRMLVAAPGRVEAVSYWIRIGSSYSPSAWTTRYRIFSDGLRGRIPDGMLVRVSTIVPSAESAVPATYRLQEGFLAELVAAGPPDARGLLSL